MIFCYSSTLKAGQIIDRDASKRCEVPKHERLANRQGISLSAALAQLGEGQTEDLKVPGSIPGRGIRLCTFESELYQRQKYRNSKTDFVWVNVLRWPSG